MRIAIFLSIALHAGIFYSYSFARLSSRESYRQQMNICYTGIVNEEHFRNMSGRTLRKTISSVPQFTKFANSSEIWEAPGVPIPVEWELFPKPLITRQDITPLLKKGIEEPSLGIIEKNYSKEFPSLIEEEK